MATDDGKRPVRFHRKDVQRQMVKNAGKAKFVDKLVSIFAIVCVILAA